MQSVNGLSLFSKECNPEMRFGTSLTTRWQLLQRYLDVFTQMMTSMLKRVSYGFSAVFSVFGQNSGDDNKADGK